MMSPSSSMALFLMLLGLALLVFLFFVFYTETEPVDLAKPAAGPPDQGTPSRTAMPEAAGLKPAVSEEEQGEQGWNPVPGERPYVAGRVEAKPSGVPVPVFDLTVEQQNKEGLWEEVLHKTLNDAEGRFRCALAKGGVTRLAVRSARYRPSSIAKIAVPEKGGADDLLVRLDEGRTLKGSVIDEETGRPVQGAYVAPAHARSAWDLREIEGGFPQYGVHARTDRNGAFVLTGLEDRYYSPLKQGKDTVVVAAVHPAFAEGYAVAAMGDEAVSIALKRGGRIEGTVEDREGRPFDRIWIEMTGREIPLALPVPVTPGGRFCTPQARPGVVVLYALPLDAQQGEDSAFLASGFVQMGEEDVDNVRLGAR